MPEWRVGCGGGVCTIKNRKSNLRLTKCHNADRAQMAP
jgi:hypothetical protein